MSSNVFNARSTTSDFVSWSKNNLAFILMLLTLILFVSKSLYNLPVSIMALIGLRRCFPWPSRLILDNTVKVFVFLFLALWLPLLFSMADAVNFAHSARTTFPYLRFLFMGIYILDERKNLLLFCKLRAATFWVITFWSLDATMQYFVGVNLFGYPYREGDITGMFYPDNTITHMLAALSPLHFDSLREYSKKHSAAWLLVLPLFAVVLLGGRRAAWIMMAISVGGYLLFLLRHTDTLNVSRKALFASGLACITMLVLLVYTNKPLQDRLQATAGLFSMDYELADQATSRRLPIWETSIKIIRNNWINGIGPRGFRHVYQQFSTADNFFYDTGTTHPHQLLLEVLTETGIIGLFGLIIFIRIFYTFFLGSDRLPPTYPALLSVLIVMFPFSTNLAFYGSYWSSITWWFLLYCFMAKQYYLNRPFNPAELPREK